MTKRNDSSGNAGESSFFIYMRPEEPADSTLCSDIFCTLKISMCFVE